MYTNTAKVVICILSAAVNRRFNVVSSRAQYQGINSIYKGGIDLSPSSSFLLPFYFKQRGTENSAQRFSVFSSCTKGHKTPELTCFVESFAHYDWRRNERDHTLNFTSYLPLKCLKVCSKMVWQLLNHYLMLQNKKYHYSEQKRDEWPNSEDCSIALSLLESHWRHFDLSSLTMLKVTILCTLTWE